MKFLNILTLVLPAVTFSISGTRAARETGSFIEHPMDHWLASRDLVDIMGGIVQARAIEERLVSRQKDTPKFDILAYRAQPSPPFNVLLNVAYPQYVNGITTGSEDFDDSRTVSASTVLELKRAFLGIVEEQVPEEHRYPTDRLSVTRGGTVLRGDYRLQQTDAGQTFTIRGFPKPSITEDIQL